MSEERGSQRSPEEAEGLPPGAEALEAGADRGSPRERVAARLEWQGAACRLLASPFYGSLLEKAAADVQSGGPAWSVLGDYAGAPRGWMLGLRLMGAVHRLVLEGQAPDLARFYGSMGGEPGEQDAWEAFRRVLERHRDELRLLMERPVQTNEVGRSAGLVGGFLSVARRFGLPLRLLEVGTSAGLNLLWDRFFYLADEGPERGARPATWGDEASRVRLGGIVGAPPFDVQGVRVAERRGCDASPLYPTSEDDRLTLMSYVWPDQTERVDLLRAALEVARLNPPLIERAAASDWLGSELSEQRFGEATVVFHSIVMQYLSPGERERVSETIEFAGSNATEQAPVAWLRMEPGGVMAEVRLSMWPPGSEALIARAGYHGRPVHWLGDGI